MQSKRLDKRNHNAIEQRHREKILHIDGHPKASHRRNGIGYLVPARDIKPEYHIPRRSKQSAGKGIHPLGVGKHVYYQSWKERQRKHPIDTHVNRQAYEEIYEHKRSGDIEDADVVATVLPQDIEISDNIEDCNIKGEIISQVYKGDHYLLIVRTEGEEDFIIETPYTFNVNDIVGLKINKENIQLRLKGDLDQYEN